MPKAIEVRPENVFAKNELKFKPIPVNAYDKSIDEEKKLFSKDDLTAIYHDMCLIREFETILNRIKTEGKYKETTYNHAGPAHLSIGQEPSAVGQAFALKVEDHIYGSHRSHGEILAKGLSAIRELDEDTLMKIMKSYFDGLTLKAVEKDHKGTVKELAVKYLVYGAYAEIFAKDTGFNRGMGGSMHCFFPPFGIYPNNAIVGGSGSVSPGAALYKRVNRKSGIVVCNIGDASFSCGPVWEGISFASMDQYRTLWDKSLGGGLPILFNCFNNHYGMGGQTCGETMGYQFLARIGAGVNAEQLHAERINGYNPLAIIDAIRRKKKILGDGLGPVLLDTVTYRVSGHSPSDASSYRSKEEIDSWIAADAIPAFRKKMVDDKTLSAKDADTAKESAESLVYEMFKLGVDMEISPRIPVTSEFISTVMFSNKRVENCDESRKPELNHPLSENPRVKQNADKARYAFDVAGNTVPKMKQFNVRDGLFEASMHRYTIDSTLTAFGEENRDWGGAFAVYRGMTEALPYHRLFNSPISEAAIVGAAVGYALEGGRAIAELMYCDFLGRAGDEVFNQLSKWQAMSGGILRMPVVLRISVGAKYGAQHSQDWTAMVAHIPGLKVVYPVTPYDAKGLMNSALAGTDPVIFLESQKCYETGELFEKSGVPTGYYEIPIGEPSIKKQGRDITLITLGPTLYSALPASKILEEKYGVSVEIIDLLSANPLNYAKIVESVKKTGKAVLLTDAAERGSFMHTVASRISEYCFDSLDSAPAVVGSRNWITPAAELEAAYFPQINWLLDAIHERVLPLKGHSTSTNQSVLELRKRDKEGV
jgi:2-oxoisovalerate dehydrogenase E1 component